MKKKLNKKSSVTTLDDRQVRLVTEGVFDFLISLLKEPGKSNWSNYTDVNDESVIPISKNFRPKENIRNQIDAVVCVLQRVGYAINGFDDTLSSLESRLVLASENADDNEFFAQQFQYFVEEFDQFLIGQFVGWVQDRELKQCSGPVSKIFEDIASDDMVQVLDEIQKSLSDIKALDIPGEALKVFEDESAKPILKERPDLEALYDELADEFNKLDSVLERLPTFKENVSLFLALAEEKVETPAVASSAEPVEGTPFQESKIPRLSDVLFD